MSSENIRHLLFYEEYVWEIYLPFRLHVNDEVHMDLFFDREALIEGGEENDELYHLLGNKEVFEIQSITIDFDDVEVIRVRLK